MRIRFQEPGEPNQSAEFRACAEKNFPQGCGWFDSRDGKLIQNFLRDYHDAPDLVLIRVMKYCNWSSGHPTWRLDFHIPVKEKVDADVSAV